jgi:hypothetical protein
LDKNLNAPSIEKRYMQNSNYIVDYVGGNPATKFDLDDPF